MSLRGHRTSLALEPAFWAALDRAAADEGVSLAGLIARIDAARMATGTPLASAARVWVLERAQADRDRGAP